MNKFLPSTSIRLALGYAGLFIVSSLVLVGFLWWRTADYLDREINAVIVADTRAIADRMRDFGLSGAIDTIDERISRAADRHTVYLLTDPRLSPIAGNLDAWPAGVSRSAGWYRVDLVHDNKLYATRFLNVQLPGDFHLLVGRDVQDRAVVRALILQGLVWAGLIAVVLAVLGGVLVRRSVLRRVEAINRTARAIVRGDLSQRLPTRNSTDEFDQLVQTINAMLGQIQLLIEGVRNTSNAVAHDLRTPLTELRSRLEGMLRGAILPEAATEDLHEAVADIDRLIGIFNALLRLAELDSGVRRAGFRRVELADLVDEVADVYGPSAEEKGIALNVDVEDRASVTGDPFLLAQAVGNLVDNAVKYTQSRGTISLRLARRGDRHVAVIVTDTGPGIPEEERAHAVERFYRGDASRRTPGVGLGLSVVEAVARLHGGALELADNHPGLIASLIVPKGENRQEPGDLLAGDSVAGRIEK
jgi:signal transduction histidine kinase